MIVLRTDYRVNVRCRGMLITMQRLIGFSLLLIVVFTPLIVAAQQHGHTAPPPEVVSLLHLHDCELPCWAGIVLRRTTLDEAKQHLLALYSEFDPQIKFSSDTSFTIMLHDAEHNQLGSIQVLSNYQLVSSIRLILFNPRPHQLLEIMQVYGLPNCTSAENTLGAFAAISDRADQGTQLFVGKTLTPVSLLTFAIETPRSPCRESYPAWRGFTYR
jgi:hypothetical protein